MHFHINGIFIGIRIFQHLNLLLVRFDPISRIHNKPQNAYLYKTALYSPRLLRFQTSMAMKHLQRYGIESFLWRFSIKSEDYSTNYGFLKRIISADDVVSDAFRWHSRQNEGVTGTCSIISWSAKFYWWILHVQSGSAGERYSSAAWNL